MRKVRTTFKPGELRSDSDAFKVLLLTRLIKPVRRNGGCSGTLNLKKCDGLRGTVPNPTCDILFSLESSGCLCEEFNLNHETR